MQTLKDLADYTLCKKQHQLGKKDYFFYDSEKKIHDYVSNQGKLASIFTAMDFLSGWYHYNFIYNFLSNKKISDDDLSISTIYALEANNICFFLGKKIETFKFSIQFDKAVGHMAQALLLGWDITGIKYGKLLLKMLYGKQYKGWHPVYKHPWFMLEIFCRWQNIQLDYPKLNYPKDMGIYQDVIDNWDTRNTDLLSQLVNKMVQFHIEASDENENEDRTSDFSSSDYFILVIHNKQVKISLSLQHGKRRKISEGLSRISCPI
ncbi:hypothetical protein FACS189426_23050 [Bacteroidia bacterium]|nr:hypothetical protein FACS189426_23050 [Bacteroidia bacterium]